jgi:hypothetical protein
MTSGERQQLGWLTFMALGGRRTPSSFARYVLLWFIVFTAACLAIGALVAVAQGWKS